MEIEIGRGKKARRAYGFASGLLLAWELVGIDEPVQPPSRT